MKLPLSWLATDDLIKKGKPTFLTTAAHEIGHVLLGRGHPTDDAGPAPLPGTNRGRRLMATDPWGVGPPPTDRRVLVKAEWDEAHGKLVEILEPPQP